ncbi:unnamed protein product, partial [marine sediment metagenome]
PYWILTDKLLTRKGKGDAVINDSREGGCRGRLELTVDGDPLVIERSRKHTTAGTGLIVIYKGDPLTHRLDGDKQAELNKILGEGFLDFLLKTVILREGLSNKFSKLGSVARQELLENYLDMTAYEYFSKYIGSEVRKLHVQISGLNTEASFYAGDLSRLRERIKSLVDKQAQIDASLEQDIQKLVVMRDTHYRTLLNLKSSMQNTLASRDYMEKAKDKLISENTPLSFLVDELRAERNSV